MAQCCAPCKNPVVFRASSKSQKSEWFFSKSACVRTQIVPRARSKLLRASLRHVSEVVKTRNAQMSSLSTKVEDGPLDMETRSSGFEQPWNAFIDMMSCFATSEGRVARSMRELGLVRKEKIGYGIVGEIYRASMAVPENGRIIDVAVKSLTREAEKSRSNRKRFKMEMDIWAPLKHPNIVSVLKTTSHPGRILVTEMCEEGRLLKYLQAGSSWIRETCEVGEGLGNASCDAELNIKNTALDIAHALEYLHSQGILHGDVKSANVLLDRSVGSHELVAKLCDFGAAEWVGEAGKRRRSVPAVCTPVWAAPEVLDPTILDTPLVLGNDVFSFGMVMYELLVQGLPWTAEEAPARVMSHDEVLELVVTLGKRPLVPDWVPASMSELLRQCWAHSPKDRPSMPQIVSALQSIPREDWELIQVCAYRKIESRDG